MNLSKLISSCKRNGATNFKLVESETKYRLSYDGESYVEQEGMNTHEWSAHAVKENVFYIGKGRSPVIATFRLLEQLK